MNKEHEAFLEDSCPSPSSQKPVSLLGAPLQQMVLLSPWGLPLMDLVQCLCFTGGVSDAGHSSVHSFGVYMSALPL